MNSKKEPNNQHFDDLRAEFNFGQGLTITFDDPLEIQTTGKYSAQNYIKRLKQRLSPEQFKKLEKRIEESGLTFSSDWS